MTSLPKIIDNRRKKLVDCLIEASKDHDELSIATGYWDLKGTQLLLPYIQNYKKIRILIGRELLIPRHQLNEIEVDYPDRDIFQDLQHLKPDSGLRPTIVELKKLIEADVLQVKVFKKTFLHAKCYIFGGFNSKSAVGIIGSSNFTGNGLTSNFELNAGESDHRIVQFHPTHEDHENGHLSWFEEAWNDENCVEWTGQFEELIDTSIHGEMLFSPYEMYIKTLDYMYGDLLKNDREITHLSSKKLQDFQERSVKQIMWRLEKNGVAMLADSVGLGKTITAIGVIKQYSGKRIVVIAPKSLVGQWKTEIARERLLGITVISLQNKNEIEEEQKKDKYLPVSLFVIDESHNLRSQNSKRFDQIKEWVINNENADTLLLTATPVNNSIDDLTNQILIGTRGEQDLLKVNVRNSEGVVKSRSFFDALADIKKKISQNRAQGNDMKPIYEEARQIIDPILREFVIRNTRQSIEKELEGKGLDIDGKSYKFPKIKVSNVDFFSGTYDSIKLQDPITAIENCSVDFIQGTTDKLEQPLRQMEEWKNQVLDTSDKSAIYRLYQYILSLSFVPYRTAMYDHRVYGKTLDEIKLIKFKDDTTTTKNLKLQLSMYGLLRIVLMKRFESSAFALLASVKKYQKRLKAFEEIFNTKKILLNLSEIDNILEEFSEDSESELDLNDDDVIKRAEASGIKVSDKTHDIKAISEDIASERRILDRIVELADLFNRDDKKLDVFKKLISDISHKDPKQKVLIFSFFSDTVGYLKDTLQDKSVFTSQNSAFVSGRDRTNALTSADRFAPVARDGQEVIEKEGELTYLVSTDVLAEGQNLQDCGLLINYDLHWNPVRMIQRNGRINRLGSPHSEIEVKNIIPHKELEQFLGLVSKLQDKISLIQATIGSDSSVLGEEINPIDYKGIYDQDSSLATQEYLRLEQEADVFTDDQYIADLKDFYEKSTDQVLTTIDKIPANKWGILDPQKVSQAPESIIFTRIEFSNGKDQYTFYKNNSQGTAIGVLLTGEALQILRSSEKKRSLDKISLNKGNQFEAVVINGPQITRYERDPERLTPSQVSLMEEARITEWSADDRQRLEALLTTRNVFQGRLARKLTKEIREVIKEGKFSKVPDVLKKIKDILPSEASEQVKAKSITPIFGFARDNR